jgi:hypothetical protein
MDTMEMGMSQFVSAFPAGALSGRASCWKQWIGQRVRLARQKASTDERVEISQDVLARRLKMHPRRLWEIENGLLAIDAVEIAWIGKALTIHPGWFYDQGGWEEWRATPRRSVMWMVARSLGELDLPCRTVLEQLIAALGARRPCAGRPTAP